MIARLTRWLLALQIAAAAGIACYLASPPHIHSFWLASVISIGVVLLVRLGIVANNFFISWKYGSPTPSRFELDPWQRYRLFFREFSASMISSSWLMPFFSLPSADRTPSAALPVLLVHGYGCNSAYWIPMSRELIKAGIAHDGIDMEPLLADIDIYSETINQAVNEMCTATGHRKIILVAHSMGGVAARAYLRRHGNEKIAKIITLGTPHHGTVLGNFGIGTNSRQMGVSGKKPANMQPSDWLKRLGGGESQETRALFVSIYSHHDNIVVPQTSSQLPGAKNIEFGGIGHVTLAFDPEIQATVIGEILRASAETMQSDARSSTQSNNRS